MGKKIILLSLQDHTGSGYRMTEAIGLNTYHFVEYMVLLDDMSGHNALKYPFMYSKRQGVVNGWNIHQRKLDHAQKLIDNADIIHLKGDELPNRDNGVDNFYGLIIPRDKPRIITVGGSYFRRGKSNIAMPLFPIKDYVDMFDVRTALTPDLNYREFKGSYIPHAYNCVPIKNKWKSQKIPLIVHNPSGNDKKGTKAFMKVIERLKKRGYKFKINTEYDITHKKCMEHKVKATIFFDQMSKRAWFGMAGIEAMAMGIPTVAFLSDMGLKQGMLCDIPVINCGQTLTSLELALQKLLDMDDLTELSEKTKEYCDQTYSYEVIGKKWGEIYDSL